MIFTVISRTTSFYHRFFSFFGIFSRHQQSTVNGDKIERGLQKIKQGTMPKTPQTVQDIIKEFAKDDISDAYGCSLHTHDYNKVELTEKYQFFDTAVERATYSFCVFSSKATIKLINQHIPQNERNILMDATFRICPNGPFKQLLILYIRKHRKVCMFSFLLLSILFFLLPSSHLSFPYLSVLFVLIFVNNRFFLLPTY